MNYLRPALIGLTALAAVFAQFAPGESTPAYAATFTVTKTADTNDGICDADCSLREAIGAANALAGVDTVNLPAGTYTLSIAGANENANATGDLDITDDLTINGAGQATTIIDGGALDRVFHIHPGNTVGISGVTVRNGSVSGTFPDGAGGGILAFGSTSTLTLTASTVSGNVAMTGGGIFSFNGALTVTDSTINGNTAPRGGGGIISALGTLTMSDSTVSGNTASLGGGILSSGTAEIIHSALDSNIGSRGGGILNDDDGDLTLTNSIVSGNAAGVGGGIFNFGMAALTNSTVSGNTASAASGGGISNYGSLTLANSTITGNAAPHGGGIFASSGDAMLKNTIVANSPSGGDCGGGGITSLGHNLDSDGTCGLGGAGDLPNTAPLLDALADNGGPTQTHALLPGSPAIDAGSGDCPPPAADQRGVPRPQGAACDIGAFELVQVVPVEIDIKPGSDPNSINSNNRGVIPVAIQSTPDFDAPTEVDKDSLTFGRTGDEPSLAFCPKGAEDVNGDGLLDQVCHFHTQDTGFQCGDVEGVLRGETLDGVPIEGTDSVRIVPCR